MDLIIDCSLNYLEIGLINNKNIVDTFFVIQNKNLTKILIPSINDFLNKNNIDKFSIKNLYIINGPGSFTSIKLIAILANVWKISSNINLYEVNTCLWNVNNINCFSYLDAKSSKWYVQKVENGVIKPICILENNDFEFEKNNFIKKHKFYSIIDCNQKQAMFDKWNYIKHSFNKVNKITPLYIKDSV